MATKTTEQTEAVQETENPTNDTPVGDATAAALAEAEQAAEEDAAAKAKAAAAAKAAKAKATEDAKAAKAAAEAAAKEAEAKAAAKEAEANAKAVVDSLVVKVTNNGPHSFETFTKTDLPAGATVEIKFLNPNQKAAAIRTFKQLNTLAKKDRYVIEG